MTSMGQTVYPFERRPAFLLSLLLSFVIILGVACIVAHKSFTKAIDATIRSNETRATLLAKLILEHQRAAIGVLRSYARRSELGDSIKRRDFEATLRHLVDLAKNNPEMDWPFIANPDSTVWVNYPVDRQVMNKDLTYRDWYKGVSKEWKPYISSVYKLIVGGKDLAVAVSVPILGEKGKVIGILATAQSTAFFREIIGEIGLNLDAKITLIDQEGHIIYSNRAPYTKEIIGYPSIELVRKAMKGEKGNVEVRDASDGDRIQYVSFTPIEGIGWSVIVEQAKSEVLRSEYSNFVLIGVVSLLIYGVVVLFLVLLRERHRHIKGLEKLNEELEGRVRERTADLETTNQNLNREITERKLAEEALREGEERLRFALEASHTGAWDLDMVDHSAYRSLEHDHIFGYAHLLPQWTYEMFLEHVLPEDRPAVDAKFRVATAARSDWNFECRIRRVDGEVRWIWAAGRHSEDATGSARRMAGIVQDITERKRTEEALRKARDELEIRVQERTADLGRTNEALRHLSSKLLSAQEEERRRIAGEIHDTLGSCLSGIKFKVDNALQEVRKGASVSMESLSAIIPVIQEGIEECRRMQMDLRPSILDDLGLLATLSWFCRRYQTIYTGIKVELEQTLEEADIPNALKIIIFRVMQEGMNNIAKHSGADLVQLSLRKMDGSIELSLEDNGQGFDLKKVLGSESTKRGLGLTSMRERTELSGGSFAIESAEGKGTILRASWPLGGKDATSIKNEAKWQWPWQGNEG
jgi:PAS domain S-box-containing protein